MSALPESVAEIQALIRSAAATGAPLVPAGRGSWLKGGGWLPQEGTVLATTRLNRLHDYEPADLSITAGAGIGLDELETELAANGQWLPLDNPGAGAGTLGAAVATGGFGPLRQRYGATRDNVLGLEVVTGDGGLLRLGGRVVKNVAGYDLVRLFVGSRGSLGVITRVSMRLFPRPERDRTLIYRVEAEGALAMARSLHRGHLPVAAVLLGGGGLEGGGGRTATLAARILGGAPGTKEIFGRVVAALGADPDEVLREGASRRFHDRHCNWEDGARLVVRLRTLPDRLDQVVAIAQPVAAAVAGKIAVDAGNGVVRVKTTAATAAPDEVVAGLRGARGRVEALGGSLTLGQAAAELAGRVGWVGRGGGAWAIMPRIKSLFDPHGVLAPRCPE